MKLAISGGEVYFSLIGNEASSHYVLIGEPVWQVKSLQELINPGETLVTPKAWFYVQKYLYVYEYVRDQRCYKVVGFKDNLMVAQRQQEASIDFHEMERFADIASSLSSMHNSYEPTHDTEVTATSSTRLESYTRKYEKDIGLICRS